MILRTVSSKNTTLYYVQKSFRQENGKNATKYVERLGNIEQLKARFGEEDPVGEAKKYVAELTRAEKEARKSVMIECNPAVLLKKGEQRSYNGGYLFLQKIYYELGLDYICKKIEKKHRNKFDLNGILSRLLYTRLLYPGSKLSSLEDSRRFIEQPQEDIHQVYRALSMLAGEFNEIQADVYRRSLKLGKRDTGVVYYDLTNYFFEWEEEGGLVQYGHSKEGRPLPIVQMGLFVDREGFPLAMCIEPGNKAESTTLKPMEEILREKFGLSRIIVCTDAGLSTYENRKNDAVSERSFITVQSVKKMGGTLQDWALSDEGWNVRGRTGSTTLRRSTAENTMTHSSTRNVGTRSGCPPVKFWSNATLSPSRSNTRTTCHMCARGRLPGRRRCWTRDGRPCRNARARTMRNGSSRRSIARKTVSWRRWKAFP